jgi:hypothetical protein
MTEREIDWEKLSPRGQILVLQIGTLLSVGYSQREIAELYDEQEAWALARVQELREELDRISTFSDPKL